MKILKILCFMLIATTAFATSALNFYTEVMRPTEKSYPDGNSWGIGVEYGFMITEHFSLGPKLNFSWNLEKTKTANPDDTKTNVVTSKQRVIMLPISMFFAVDPIPQFMIHPVIHAQVGYNSVFVSNVNYNNKDRSGKYDGYYNGVYTKFGADCMVDIGKTISLFIGPQWQISTTERRKKDTLPIESKFHGFGVRFGVSILL